MKLYSVQYMRGLAAVLVVVAHAADHPLPQSSQLLENLGELGVTLFFVISGFIMVAITGTGSFSPGRFLKRRAARVVPMYWLFTTIAALLALVMPSLFKSTVFTWPHYFESLLFIPHEAPGRGGYSPLLSLGWTLNYEIFFYLAFAACAALSSRWRVVVLTAIFAALSTFGLIVQPQNLVLSFYANVSLLAFCAGGWIGQLFIERRLEKVPKFFAQLLVVTGVSALVFGLTTDGAVTFVALLVASACLLMAGVRFDAQTRKVRPLEMLGDASYSTYLVHMFVVGVAVALASRLLPIEGMLKYDLTIATAIIGALLAGLLVHQFIERPILRLFSPRVAGLPSDGIVRRQSRLRRLSV
ncbi:exopolysaccharide production protein ExoZ [Devosia sp. UYZn731]|uniref:acyltransferase family protein n=1 Tax=Devosia sp. UYZn731 TaxID=3156345 RepID=UPI003398B374